MPKPLLIALFFLCSLSAFTQSSYQKGYYIDNDGNTVQCLIKKLDWYVNPTVFEYKLENEGTPRKQDLRSVQEFGIPPTLKYVRATVELDASDESKVNPSKDKNPSFRSETLFLRLLVDGKANLYEYSSKRLLRFYYTLDPTASQPLVYKTFTTQDGHQGQNMTFKKQLWNDLQCTTISVTRIENLSYTRKDLVKLFTDYSACQKEETSVYPVKRKSFYLNVRPRLITNKLNIQHKFLERTLDFPRSEHFALGLEAEFILINRWSMLLEPTYLKYSAHQRVAVNTVMGGQLDAHIASQNLEIPISVRRYFPLRGRSTLFLNGAIITNFPLSSSLQFSRADGSRLENHEMKMSNYFGVGAGFQVNKKYTLEFRYHKVNDFLKTENAWNHALRSFSFILGYRLY